jgi:hypothetical protein
MQYEKLHNLYTLPNTIRVIKSKRMKLLGHVVCMGEMRNAYNILFRKPEGRPLGRPTHRWKIILEWILGKLVGKVWTGVIWLKIGKNGRPL